MKNPSRVNTYKRFYELDLLRGAAIILMVVIHALHTLNFFGSYNYTLGTGYLLYLSRTGASIFIILAGISLTLSSARAKARAFKKNLKRGAVIFSWGLLITLITRLTLGEEGFVIFGILHFIGLSIILAYPFLKFAIMNLLLGITIIMLSFPMSELTMQAPWFLWLGLRPAGFYSIDFFPLFPWFGIFLIGIFLGNTFYPEARRKFSLPEFSENTPLKFLVFIGKNSLMIYLLHQPILILILFLLGFIIFPLP